MTGREEDEFLKKLDMKLDMIISALGIHTKPMTISDIAVFYGKSRSSMYTTWRVLIPNYGVTEGEGSGTWTMQEVIEWNERSLEERRKEYDMLKYKKA